MALTWSTENVKHFIDNPDDLWVTYRAGQPDEYTDVNAETKSIIFGTMAVGIGDINYKNAPSFYARWKVMEKIDGLTLYRVWQDGKFKDVYITPEVVAKHFGLFTNVSNIGDKDWVDRFYDNYIRENTRTGRYTQFSNKDLKDMIKKNKQEFENYFIGIAQGVK